MTGINNSSGTIDLVVLERARERLLKLADKWAAEMNACTVARIEAAVRNGVRETIPAPEPATFKKKPAILSVP